MKELLFSIMSVSICAAVISMLSPENEAMKKQISFVCALMICVSLTLPIIRFITGEKGGLDLSLPSNETEETPEALDAVINAAKEKICDNMEKVAENRYGIKNAVLTLTLDTDDKENIKIISGVLEGEGDIKEAAQYIGKELGCEIRYEE